MYHLAINLTCTLYNGLYASSENFCPRHKELRHWFLAWLGSCVRIWLPGNNTNKWNKRTGRAGHPLPLSMGECCFWSHYDTRTHLLLCLLTLESSGLCLYISIFLCQEAALNRHLLPAYYIEGWRYPEGSPHQSAFSSLISLSARRQLPCMAAQSSLSDAPGSFSYLCYKCCPYFAGMLLVNSVCVRDAFLNHPLQRVFEPQPAAYTDPASWNHSEITLLICLLIQCLTCHWEQCLPEERPLPTTFVTMSLRLENSLEFGVVKYKHARLTDKLLSEQMCE